MQTSAITNASTTSAGTRLLCACGVLVTAALIYLGAIWPSLYTLIALPTLPSPIIFLVAVFRPSLVQRHRFVRWYLIACCVVSALTWIYDFWWLRHTT